MDDVVTGRPFPASGTLLGVFGKHWTPGAVKTRLAAAIGREAASQLYRTFFERTLDRFSAAAEQCVLAFWPPERRDEFAFAQSAGWRLQPQTPGDLGARMKAFFEESFACGAQRVALIGSDSPTLPIEFVGEAFDRLNQKQVVLGPARDGGYYLIGAAHRSPPIFDDVAWGTADVFRATLAQLERHQTSYALLPEWYDVDDASDLIRLERELGALAKVDLAWTAMLEQVRKAKKS